MQCSTDSRAKTKSMAIYSITWQHLLTLKVAIGCLVCMRCREEWEECMLEHKASPKQLATPTVCHRS